MVSGDAAPQAKAAAWGPEYPVNVLFLCSHNSCRSQMADGWARKLRGDAPIGVASAGIKDGARPHTLRACPHASKLAPLEP